MCKKNTHAQALLFLLYLSFLKLHTDYYFYKIGAIHTPTFKLSIML